MNSIRVNFVLPKEIYYALKALVPARQRSKVVSNLIKNEIQKIEEKLYKIAKAVDHDHALNQEMKDWDSTQNDGLGEIEWK